MSLLSAKLSEDKSDGPTTVMPPCPVEIRYWRLFPDPDFKAVMLYGVNCRTRVLVTTSAIVERLAGDLVKTRNGSAIRLVGPSRRDEMIKLFSPAFADRFWDGFPEDWQQLVQHELAEISNSSKRLEIGKIVSQVTTCQLTTPKTSSSVAKTLGTSNFIQRAVFNTPVEQKLQGLKRLSLQSPQSSHPILEESSPAKRPAIESGNVKVVENNPEIAQKNATVEPISSSASKRWTWILPDQKKSKANRSPSPDELSSISAVNQHENSPENADNNNEFVGEKTKNKAASEDEDEFAEVEEPKEKRPSRSSRSTKKSENEYLSESISSDSDLSGKEEIEKTKTKRGRKKKNADSVDLNKLFPAKKEPKKRKKKRGRKKKVVAAKKQVDLNVEPVEGEAAEKPPPKKRGGRKKKPQSDEPIMKRGPGRPRKDENEDWFLSRNRTQTNKKMSKAKRKKLEAAARKPVWLAKSSESSHSEVTQNSGTHEEEEEEEEENESEEQASLSPDDDNSNESSKVEVAEPSTSKGRKARKTKKLTTETEKPANETEEEKVESDADDDEWANLSEEEDEKDSEEEKVKKRVAKTKPAPSAPKKCMDGGGNNNFVIQRYPASICVGLWTKEHYDAIYDGVQKLGLQGRGKWLRIRGAYDILRGRSNVEIRDAWFRLKACNMPKVTKPRRAIRYWVPAEYQAIKDGVLRFGAGKWREIRDAYPVLAQRNNIDVRDAWCRLLSNPELLVHNSSSYYRSQGGATRAKKTKIHVLEIVKDEEVVKIETKQERVEVALSSPTSEDGNRTSSVVTTAN